jgi:hypothetical protein
MIDIYFEVNPSIRRRVNEEDPDFEMPEGFTKIKPLGLEYAPRLPVQHLDNGVWILDDDCIERQQLDSMTHLPALAIRRAMGNIPVGEGTAEDSLDALFISFPEFEKEWVIAPGNIINLSDEAVVQAMSLIDVDIDDIKRQILCQI